MRIIATFSKFQRNGTNRTHIVGHVITLHAIAPRDRLHQLAVHIRQRDAQSVIFHLGTDLEVLAFKTLLHTIVEVPDLTLIIGISQRQHRVFMRHSLERLVQVASHPLRRRVRVGILRIEQLKIFQTMHHLVKVIIRNRWLIQHIIIIIVLLQLLPELIYFFFWSHNVF